MANESVSKATEVASKSMVNKLCWVVAEASAAGLIYIC